MTEETKVTGEEAEENKKAAPSPEAPADGAGAPPSPEPPASEAATDLPADPSDPELVPDEESKEGKNKSEGKYKKENRRLAAQLKEMEQNLIEVQNKYLALYAEYDNYRKRTVKEKEAILTDATADCLVAILPVIDNLERALSFPEGEKVVEGVRMTMNIFADTLKRLGVEEVPTETFDPTCHNAVMHIEDETFGEGQIVAVFQKGYRKGDKLLRAAMVKVAN